MIKFEKSDLDSGEVNTLQTCLHSTWGELADRFFDFLMGCGYQLSREDLADHFAEYTRTDDSEAISDPSHDPQDRTTDI